MSDKLYELMDWPEIEAVVYSEEYAPREILGPVMGCWYSAFFRERTK